MSRTIYLNEFFDELDFTTEVHYISHDESTDEKIYTINGESVFIEFKNEVRPHHISLFEKTRSKELPVLVASKYITPKAKEALKARNINYIDSFGNAFLHLDGIKLYVEKNNAKPVYKTNTKIFTQAGCQLLFQLLKHPESINETVRFLAQKSNISVGSVSKILNHLQGEGFVVKWNNEQKYQLVRREELLERWIPSFNEKVLPNYKIGNYTFNNRQANDWQNKLLYPNLLWGGEPAASILTNYLIPETFTLYTRKSKQEIITRFQLIPDPEGTITVYAKFWQEESVTGTALNNMNKKNVVHPLLIYAELIYSGNDRNIETAKIIFDEYIKPNL